MVTINDYHVKICWFEDSKTVDLLWSVLPNQSEIDFNAILMGSTFG